MRIESVHFQNYKLLRDTTLPLEPLTLLVGANGSGKSTALEALQNVAENRADRFVQARTLGVPRTVRDGGNLATALDQLRDRDPERWLELNDALPGWIPEFDRVLFETPEKGQRRVVLRTRRGQHRVPSQPLSAGTRLALGLLAITYGASDTSFLGIEEPETGIHPRLLRNVYDALVRMAYPDPAAGGPGPRQVIVTTHSPYLLDLFRDQPESVVVAERHYDRPVEEATFTRLSDHRNIDEIVSAGPLGEAWYTGVLGGVPVLPGPAPVTPAAPAGA